MTSKLSDRLEVFQWRVFGQRESETGTFPEASPKHVLLILIDPLPRYT